MWYYVRNEKRVGPVLQSEIEALINDGSVTRETSVWREGMADWAAAGSTDLAARFATIPPSVPLAAQTFPRATTDSASSGGDVHSLRSLWIWMAWLIGAGAPLVLVVVGILPLIAGMIIQYVLLYRFWSVIQDGKPRTTPGAAVGLCFVPFFDFYWLFVAVAGLATDLNAYCDAKGISAPRCSRQLAIAYCVLLVCGVIPYVGVITVIPAIVIGIILWKQFVETAVRIAEAKRC